MDYIKELDELCEILSEKIADKTRRIKSNGMSDGDLDTIDKLTHSLASVKKILAFMEDDGYSGNYPTDYRGVYRGSYARGRNARRDSMGRYSGEHGYSRNDLADRMRDLMRDAPDDRTRQDIQRLVEKMESP